MSGVYLQDVRDYWGESVCVGFTTVGVVPVPPPMRSKLVLCSAGGQRVSVNASLWFLDRPGLTSDSQLL